MADTDTEPRGVGGGGVVVLLEGVNGVNCIAYNDGFYAIVTV